jgi:hypothetical protein
MISFSQLGYQGQLGNQMFQYALLKAVGAARGYQVKIPKRFARCPSWVPKMLARQSWWARFAGYRRMRGWVELEPFELECDELTPGETRQLAHRYEEPKFTYCADVFDTPDNTDFIGFFQSPRYWQAIEPQIRREFRFRPRIARPASAYLDDLRAEPGAAGRAVVSLHVRRGDYLRSAAKGCHRVVGRDYYQAAIERFPEARFLVFSDDIPWCRAQFTSEPFRFCRTDNHWLDMAIMSRCDHHINCASTFSWWGAWLNPSPAKQVVVPSPWFGPLQQHCSVEDMIPSEWLRL